MLKIVPYELEDIKNYLKYKAITEMGLTDSEYEGSNIAQLINLLSYATLINNTNFTFGLNEMFISQAVDRKNVIKHARQLGYSHKRRVSYQYKIKLKTVKAGEITLPKYSTFTSNGNDYVYLGKSITEIYGTFVGIRLSNNEYNNNTYNMYYDEDIEVGGYIITEEGLVCKILEKELESEARFLLEPLAAKNEIPKYSQIGQDLYIQDSHNQLNPDGYRNFIKVGSVDTFILDKDNSVLKVQITKNDDVVFPTALGTDGYLDARIFFSDLRGEVIENETEWDSLLNPLGWNGFYANFNEETNVLTFRIGLATDEEIASNITYGRDFHNPYVYNNGMVLGLEDVLTTPFKKTRFSKTIQNVSSTGEILGYDPFAPETCFGIMGETFIKDELEIIVKEGVVTQWTELTAESEAEIALALENNTNPPLPVYKNQDLIIAINQDMVDAGYFTIRDDGIEDTGIEMFVTRVLDDGTIVYNEFWVQRKFLLAEDTEVDVKSFISMTDIDYEEFINVYTKYAGTGTPLSVDMTMKLNLLRSKGAAGSTTSLIIPTDENFKATYYVEETLTPSILHVSGSDIQSTDEIRNTAPLFSNTANRAVTKLDYKTICEAQPYIQSAEIWGGEEETPHKLPGYIFFSIVPYSRPIVFNKSTYNYNLKNVDNDELFYPSYYQITGKERYDLLPNTVDQEVLFNFLENFKIITLQFEYVKTIYLDFDLEVKVLKYRFGQTIAQSNEEIFSSIRKYFAREIEKFNSDFYLSSLIRHIDSELGDAYGIGIDVNFSVSIKDSIISPDTGNFACSTLYDNKYFVIKTDGDSDLWKYRMPIAYPIEDMYEKNIIVDSIVKYRGRMITDNITNCNTKDFIVMGDYLYMELEDINFVSYSKDGREETILANRNSAIVIISIYYVKNYAAAKLFEEGKINPSTGNSYTEDEVNVMGGRRYKVGTYSIHSEERIIRLELNAHTYKHFDSIAKVEQSYIDDNLIYWAESNEVEYVDEDLGKTMYYLIHSDGTYQLDDEGNKKITLFARNDADDVDNIPVPYIDVAPTEEIKTGEDYHKYTAVIAPFPREYFVASPRKMNINPKGDNILTKRNVFSRMKILNYI